MVKRRIVTTLFVFLFMFSFSNLVFADYSFSSVKLPTMRNPRTLATGYTNWDGKIYGSYKITDIQIANIIASVKIYVGFSDLRTDKQITDTVYIPARMTAFDSVYYYTAPRSTTELLFFGGFDSSSQHGEVTGIVSF